MSTATDLNVASRRAASASAFARAQDLMPGGVSSPVRAYKAVGGDPVYIRSGKGAVVTDLDGLEYVDYVGSYGPLILGHAPDTVLAALSKAAARGTTFGMPTEAESTLAAMVIDAVPSVEMVRFVNSGTEAAMSAIRLARAATGRPAIVKCTGCYHGHSDALLVEAGSGALTLGQPSSPGVPKDITQNTLLVPFNDLEAARAVFEAHPDQIAAFAVEPVGGNMGCVPPVEGYLEGLRSLCDEFGAMLLFDEVMTGFRVARGGAQELYAVTPDLTCLGKVIGGGLPCAAYGGRRDLMEQVAPAGPMYQAGTLSGNPLAMAAGIATLAELENPDLYGQLESTTRQLAEGLATRAERAGVPVQIARVGSMLCVFFAESPVLSYEQAVRCRTDRFAAFFNAMLERGVILPPSQYECWFISAAHDGELIKQTLQAAEHGFAAAVEIA
ncbi:glutamate-1-semialdehyde 2,1-aminomutase [Mucisphaera calidilacus]|uniref:Glutamate-1-semialdehyde 2,1-aminomutase n=1 Tax=Mucisphaera calidilacus TaxID=2527982 RepID=A0A518BVZ3_9BACT|nr:glutamate-1-semialdehyde 2,1-aminomutase [Mucisphaera calidilacus]QDU71153.1 Glutamate-1-semialdehyde 2,1-aminomutase [Mucisphaera calidilacus]